MQSIYMDYNATTPVDPQVFEAMNPYLHEKFGNAASSNHSFGWSAEEAIAKARRQVANYLHCESHEVFFTSGATESNNWALRGTIEQIKLENRNEPIHIISSPIEHSSVHQCLEHLRKLYGFEISWAKVDAFGQVDVESVKALIKPHTKLISFMWVNNEVGTINKVKELGEIAKQAKAYFHCDGTQAMGRLAIDLKQIHIDLLSFSGHKIYGPKGVGVLFIRSHDPKVQIAPLFVGGGQERGERSGTQNVPGIVGLGKACELLKSQWETESQKTLELRNFLWQKIKQELPQARLNGHPEQRACNILNVTFVNSKVPSQFPGLAVSKSSACHSGPQSHSHVLSHLGFSSEEMDATVRISLGRMTTEDDLIRCLEILKKTVAPK